jgi:hypothetical protein
MIDIRPVEPHVQIIQPVIAVRPVDKDAGTGNQREPDHGAAAEQEPEPDHDLVEVSEAYLAQVHPVAELDETPASTITEAPAELHIDIEA